MAKKKKKKAIDLETLITVAENMNKIMGLEPEIDTDLDEDDLLEAIKLEADEVMGNDKLSDETWATLEELGVAEDAIAYHNEALEEDDDDEEDDDEEEETPKKKSKKKSKVKPEEEEDDGEDDKDDEDDESEDDVEDDEEEDEKPKKGKKKMATKKKTDKKVETKKTEKKAPAKVAKKEKKVKKPGVIGSIFDLISKKAMSKEGLVKELTKMFPDRDPESMAKTVNVQLPNRMAKEKGVKITENKGKFAIK